MDWFVDNGTSSSSSNNNNSSNINDEIKIQQQSSMRRVRTAPASSSTASTTASAATYNSNSNSGIGYSSIGGSGLNANSGSTGGTNAGANWDHRWMPPKALIPSSAAIHIRDTAAISSRRSLKQAFGIYGAASRGLAEKYGDSKNKQKKSSSGSGYSASSLSAASSLYSGGSSKIPSSSSSSSSAAAALRTKSSSGKKKQEQVIDVLEEDDVENDNDVFHPTKRNSIHRVGQMSDSTDEDEDDDNNSIEFYNIENNPRSKTVSKSTTQQPKPPSKPSKSSTASYSSSTSASLPKPTRSSSNHNNSSNVRSKGLSSFADDDDDDADLIASFASAYNNNNNNNNNNMLSSSSTKSVVPSPASVKKPSRSPIVPTTQQKLLEFEMRPGTAMTPSTTSSSMETIHVVTSHEAPASLGFEKSNINKSLSSPKNSLTKDMNLLALHDDNPLTSTSMISSSSPHIESPSPPSSTSTPSSIPRVPLRRRVGSAAPRTQVETCLRDHSSKHRMLRQTTTSAGKTRSSESAQPLSWMGGNANGEPDVEMSNNNMNHPHDENITPEDDNSNHTNDDHDKPDALPLHHREGEGPWSWHRDFQHRPPSRQLPPPEALHLEEKADLLNSWKQQHQQQSSSNNNNNINNNSSLINAHLSNVSSSLNAIPSESTSCSSNSSSPAAPSVLTPPTSSSTSTTVQRRAMYLSAYSNKGEEVDDDDDTASMTDDVEASSPRACDATSFSRTFSSSVGIATPNKTVSAKNMGHLTSPTPPPSSASSSTTAAAAAAPTTTASPSSSTNPGATTTAQTSNNISLLSSTFSSKISSLQASTRSFASGKTRPASAGLVSDMNSSVSSERYHQYQMHMQQQQQASHYHHHNNDDNQQNDDSLRPKTAALEERDNLFWVRPPSRQRPPPEALHLDLPPQSALRRPSSSSGRCKSARATSAIGFSSARGMPYGNNSGNMGYGNASLYSSSSSPSPSSYGLTQEELKIQQQQLSEMMKYSPYGQTGSNNNNNNSSNNNNNATTTTTTTTSNNNGIYRPSTAATSYRPQSASGGGSSGGAVNVNNGSSIGNVIGSSGGVANVNNGSSIGSNNGNAANWGLHDVPMMKRNNSNNNNNDVDIDDDDDDDDVDIDDLSEGISEEDVDDGSECLLEIAPATAPEMGERDRNQQLSARTTRAGFPMRRSSLTGMHRRGSTNGLGLTHPENLDEFDFTTIGGCPWGSSSDSDSDSFTEIVTDEEEEDEEQNNSTVTPFGVNKSSVADEAMWEKLRSHVRHWAANEQQQQQQ